MSCFGYMSSPSPLLPSPPLLSLLPSFPPLFLAPAESRREARRVSLQVRLKAADVPNVGFQLPKARRASVRVAHGGRRVNLTQKSSKVLPTAVKLDADVHKHRQTIGSVTSPSRGQHRGGIALPTRAHTHSDAHFVSCPALVSTCHMCICVRLSYPLPFSPQAGSSCGVCAGCPTTLDTCSSALISSKPSWQPRERRGLA